MDNKTTQPFNDTFLAQWLEGSISDAQLKALVSSSDFMQYQNLKAGIQLYERIESPQQELFQSIQQRIQQKPKAKVLPLFGKIAFAAAAVVLLFFSINKVFNVSTTSFETSYGENKTLALLDGSEVILNAKSQLSYNTSTWNTNREVTLDGEAFFKVKKGSTFTVQTSNGRVTVLGTQFNVSTSNNCFNVVCYQGKVKVETQNQTYTITPQQSITSYNDVVTNETEVKLDTIPTWITGESSFNKVPLHHVIVALEKQFQVSFISKDIDDTIIFTGSFSNSDLKLALASVFKPLQIQYTSSGSTISLSK